MQCTIFNERETYAKYSLYRKSIYINLFENNIELK